MPTLDEIKELVNKCDWTWTTQDGINGYEVKGPNDNSIFLPAGGRFDGSGVEKVGEKLYYPSNTFSVNAGKIECRFLGGSSTDKSLQTGFGWYMGMPIRPVRK